MCTSAFEGSRRGDGHACVHVCVVIVLREGVAIRHEKQEKKTDIPHLRAAGIGMGVHALCCVEGGGGAGVTVKA